jgi:hypothetical protein
MPHWIALLAIVVAAWMTLAVVGGWLIGRGLAVIDRRTGNDVGGASSDREQPHDVRSAA